LVPALNDEIDELRNADIQYPEINSYQQHGHNDDERVAEEFFPVGPTDFFQLTPTVAEKRKKGPKALFHFGQESQVLTSLMSPAEALQPTRVSLARFAMRSVFVAIFAELLQLHAIGVRPLVLRRRVVALLAVRASEGDNDPHPFHLPGFHNYIKRESCGGPWFAQTRRSGSNKR
jgi:hypothetical protein